MFRDAFKYYKARKPPPDFKHVIDVAKPDNQLVRRVKLQRQSRADLDARLGLKPAETWNIYEIIAVPGLIFIQNPFTNKGQQEWIVKCLKDYPKKPNVLNIDAHHLLDDGQTWWDACFGSNPNSDLLSKLRWATLGYHHNWDTKHYSEDFKSTMPADLKDLTNYFADILKFDDFNAEAAIVNYYRMNSTLAGHTDHSEVYLDAPLFSTSFGQTAIFLIGGLKQEDPAEALFLRSGDVVVMSGESRLRYHGVPKILSEKSMPWDSEDELLLNSHDWKITKSYISDARINLNVRQVLKPGQKTLTEC